MKTRPAAMLAGPLAASMAATMLLAGCGGDPKPDPSATTDTATTTASPRSAAPTASASPTLGAAHTKAGAQAFSVHFFQQVNRAWSTPDPTSLDGLYTRACKTCAAIRGSAADYKSRELRYRDTPLTGISSISLTDAVGGTTRVRVTAAQKASAIVDRNGKVVESVPRTASTFLLTLTWVRQSWQVSLMQAET